MTDKVYSSDKHPGTEVRCSRRCGWTATLSDYPLDSQGNFVLPIHCPECDDGYTYLPNPVTDRERGGTA